MSTVKDVARMAGVSIATVSRVLNGKGRYGRGTAERVLRAADALGYTANLVARGLKTGRTGTVGIVLGGLFLVDYPELLLRASEVLRAQGFDVQIFPGLTLRDSERLMSEGKLDGLLVTDAEKDDLSLKALVDAGKPFVVLGGDIEREDVNLVEVDYFQAGYIATQHLVNYGHSEILFVSGDENLPLTQEIRRGYLFALDERGIQYREELIRRADPGDGSAAGHPPGERAGYGTLRGLGRGFAFSAVLATDDRIACGSMKALLDAGRRVPEDVSVAGVGNRSITAYLAVPLTTVDVPVSQMGELGAEILANCILRRDTVVKRVKLKAHLVPRGSTAKKLT